jgi:hypothetical protein
MFEIPLCALDRGAKQPDNINVYEKRSVATLEEGVEVKNATFVDEFGSCIGEEKKVNL